MLFRSKSAVSGCGVWVWCLGGGAFVRQKNVYLITANFTQLRLCLIYIHGGDPHGARCLFGQGEKMAEESIRTHQLSKVNKRPGRGLAEATLGIC